MTPRTLQSVLRTLSDAGSPVPDAELLRRFRDGDEAAFAELVKRHGRLVWAVCRAGTNSDAEADDAFQATFLVLVRNAAKVRDAGKLSAFLHGVAFKVCAKARQGAKRRAARERATAHREGAGSAVPETAWDRALAAVHEEVATLPDTLRVPFVLCCLEGKGTTEAAEQLGWKLGTLSGRLTRAKDAVLAKLEARGLTLGVVAAVGLAVPPAAVAAKSVALAGVGFAVPSSVLQLSQGVIGMSVKSVKVLAATVLLACGLGMTVGSGWVATADAQQPAKATPKANLEAEVQRLQAQLEVARAQAELATRQAQDAAEAERKARLAAEANAKQAAEVQRFIAADLLAQAGLKQPAPKDAVAFKTAKWEYDLVDIAKTFNADTFGTFLQERENAGWEFLGATPLGASGGVFQWLFRRPVTPTAKYTVPVQDGDKPRYLPTKPGYAVEYSGSGATYYKPVVEAVKSANTVKAVGDEVKAVEAEIAKLTAKLADLKKGAAAPASVTFDKTSSPLDTAVLATVLGELAKKKFEAGKKVQVSHGNGVVTVTGDKDVLDWATAMVKSLAGK